MFSLDAVVELVRIAGTVRPAASVIQAAESIRRMLENNPHEIGYPLSEGLFYVDGEPLRAFFMIDDDAMLVEVTDFRIL